VLWNTPCRVAERVRDQLRDDSLSFRHFDATQLIKHAFGLRTSIQKQARYIGKKPVLFYLFAEPNS
jgi:hypothetical protein